MKTLKDFVKLWDDDFEQKLIEEFHKYNKPCNYNHQDKPLFIRRRIFKDGEEQYIGKCRACNKILFSTTERDFTNTCPSCGKSIKSIKFEDSKIRYSFYDRFEHFRLGRRFTTSSLNDDAFHFVYKIDDDSFVIAIIVRDWCPISNEEDVYVKDGENAWLDKTVHSVDTVIGAMFFNKKIGCRVFAKGSGVVLKNTESNCKYIRSNIPLTNLPVENESEKELINIIKDITNSSFENIIECLDGYNSYILQNKATQKNKSQKNETDYDSLIPSINKEEIYNDIKKHYISDLPGGIVDISGNTATYSLLCFCHNIIDGKKEDIHPNYSGAFEINTTCPCCGRKITQYVYTNNNMHRTTAQGRKWEFIDEKNVILRFFKVNYEINLTEKTYNVSDIIETQIYLFTPKKVFYLHKEKGRWEKGTLTSIPQYGYGSYYEYTCFNTKEDLTEIINKSFLKTSGLLQTWGLGDYADYEIESPFSNFNKSSYLYQWYKKPYLELVIKANLRTITKDLMKDDIIPSYLEKTNIYEMFDITKSILRITRLRNLSIKDMRVLKRCYEFQSNFSIEQWDEIVETGLNINKLLDTCQKTNSTIKRLMEYLQSCYDNQCIQKSNALSIYYDYYNMAEKIGFNLSDNSIKYPNSLKKEHDKAMFAYKVLEDEIKKKAFIENSIENKKYEYSKGNLTVVIPMTPDEVIREGQLQKHCVANYVNRIENGTTCICFIRKKDDIDTPYFTCEIYDGILYQVKGYCNKYPNKNDDKELIEFLNSWAQKYNLAIEYMKH